MKKIKLLSEELINKIAAGEVIESPASVVKELVDNSIDAGGTDIIVEVRGGGFQLIKVIDNGVGMDSDDAILCFEKHATSKISHIDDLEHLSSLGFRGEALASIAAIAKVDLVTAVEGSPATQVTAEAGKIVSLSPTARQEGTSIEVKFLFYNIPARKKFQKQPSAASAEIYKLLFSMGLAYPEIGFTLISNHEVTLKIEPAEGADFFERLKKRTEELFQNSPSLPNLPIQAQERGYHLQGFVGSPSAHRINRTGQYIFVNRRGVRSNQISLAMKEGFGHRLDKDRYPLFVVHLQVPSTLIDVNVHPQKKEVRFQENDFIRTFLKTQVRSIFTATTSTMPVFSTLPSYDYDIKFREFPNKEPLEKEFPLQLAKTELVIGLFQHYLLLDGTSLEPSKPGIVVIDLQKIQEQLLWNDLNTPSFSPLSQGLLLPLNLELSSTEAESIIEKQVVMTKMGFSLQRIGKKTFLIEAIPPFLHENDVMDAVRLILQSKESFAKVSKKVTHLASTKKKVFSIDEALILFKNFKKINSPEGLITIGLDEIKNLFK